MVPNSNLRCLENGRDELGFVSEFLRIEAGDLLFELHQPIRYFIHPLLLALFDRHLQEFLEKIPDVGDKGRAPRASFIGRSRLSSTGGLYLSVMGPQAGR
jgi:hypothetical protein